MSHELVQSVLSLAPLPEPRVEIAIRAGTVDDIPFMDGLQRTTTKQVGWMPTKQFEGKVKAGHVLIAESVGCDLSHHGGDGAMNRTLPAVVRSSVGYLIGNDQYFKRDDVGIIYQINVVPEFRRSLVAASLLKAQFERSAYGCRLYCCWCAQDIEANRFWESMGFVPLAFRAGSEKKARVHIFWQKRIRQGDVTTPWWFPSKTAGGAIREDRIVLPIPPGTHWSDAKPLILPEAPSEVKALPEAKHGLKARATKKVAVETPAPIRRNGLMFDIPRQGEPLPEDKPVEAAKPKAEKVKRKCDPRLASAARELRDRWLEQVNASPLIMQGKYDVCRAISEAPGAALPLKLLPAA